MWETNLLSLLPLPLLLIATWIDLKNHRIPNWLSFGTAGLGLAVSGGFLGWPGLLTSLQGLGVGLGFFIPFYLMRGMGAGDVKMMAATGACLGPSLALIAAAATQIMGGIIGLGYLIWYGGLVTLLQSLGFFGASGFILKHRRSTDKPIKPNKIRFPYAIAIFLGTSIALWQDGQFKLACINMAKSLV